MIARLPIDRLSNNIVERFKVSLIGQSFDNLKCGSNPWNDDFDYLTSDYYQILVTRQRIYPINDNMIKKLNCSSIFDVYTRQM